MNGEGTATEVTKPFIDLLRSDKEFYNAWKSNIAMCMFDALKEGTGELFGHSIIPSILNKGADNFLQLLIR